MNRRHFCGCPACAERGDAANTWKDRTIKGEDEIKRLRQTIRDTIESLERNSTSAPVVECLKAALANSLTSKL